MAPIPRFLPDEPLPSYAFVPGRHPHPLSDPAGHSHGTARPAPAAPDPDRWQDSRPYLHGLDLFNHGYYWEAHEAWEGLWHACGRRGTTAGFLKGLIQLAVAGVKVREGKAEGARSHARRAGALFAEVAHTVGPNRPCYLGLMLRDLIEAAALAAELPVGAGASVGAPVAVVLPLVLLPQAGGRVTSP